ncbi:uncharacterized protein BYT42DRAFT_550653 [Radiomyces spectabilis]|uniref:uncharacterized protein n=1 Tax=Radiomyces spectabilis TaxID=64574 RepID=UPI00221F0E53|nr:uncharacterized protein BYT42DRAFT_550653 [Radiomyces spectabilis]KAI8393322.1 hypothetical protein BYT42DRAFT_550653 [Radiomyces spectabilis]
MVPRDMQYPLDMEPMVMNIKNDNILGDEKNAQTTVPSLKRRRPGRPSKKELAERAAASASKYGTNDIYSDSMEGLQRTRPKRLKLLHGYHDAHRTENDDKHCLSTFHIGDQVEARKEPEEEEETADWYCARIVDIDKEEQPVRFFVHYEGWPPDRADWLTSSMIAKPSKRLRYGPRGKENEVSWKSYATFHTSKDGVRVQHHTGLVQDQRMSLHSCPCDSRETIHPERPDRIASILQALHNERLLRYVRHIHAREATAEELLHAHTPAHIRNYCPIKTEHGDALVSSSSHSLLVSSPTDTSSQSSQPQPANAPPQPRPKITSIAALLNEPTTPPATITNTPNPSISASTPASTSNDTDSAIVLSATSLTSPTTPIHTQSRSQRHGSIIGPVCGVGGGMVVKADQEQIKRQHRRFSSVITANHPTPLSPPDLVYKMTCGELGIAVDTTFHPLYTSISARVAAGSLLTLVDKIVLGQLRNGFALIRPPGHHAEDDAAMGFCFFNNVAVAAATTLTKYPTKIKKILIIDWDIHHGNGTQKIFYDNPNVLYISVHRWDKGKFYPFSGAPEECGEDGGLGRNVNIAFSMSEEKPKPMGDTEFIAAFHHLLIPIARQFGPDMIFVSAGFDAAEGHPENLGGYNVTPRGFALMTKMVNDLANEICDGRLVLSLEGGYELQPLANSAAASVAQLLPQDLVPHMALDYKWSLNAIKPNQSAVQSLRLVADIQKRYWNLPDRMFGPNFRFQLPSEWRARDSISTRPKREKRPMKIPIVEGY